MNRTRLLLLTLLVAILAGLTPVALVAWLGWRHAATDEQRQLQVAAERTLRRAMQAYSQALAAMDALQAAHVAPCSPAHIRLMQSKVVTTPSVDQISYFQQGTMQCSSWGQAPARIALPRPDHVTEEGVGLHLDITPRASFGRRMLSLQRGDYDTLMDPGHFVDVIDRPQVRVALATPDGRLIAQQGIRNQALLEALLRNPGNGMDDSTLYASARSEQWLAIATAPRTQLLSAFREQAGILLPLGLLLAIGCGGGAWWLLQRRLSLRGELATALRRGELYCTYQPLIALGTGVCIGAEALIRWQRPDGSHVRPDLFIPIAEEHGMIQDITDFVIHTVVREMRELLLEDRNAHIAINLAPEDMSTPRALKVIAQALEGTGIASTQIWLEATERGLMDIERARAVIAAARHAGHSVGIDDFGVGYSNLQYLQQLPVNALKIDKAFIDAIGTGSATAPVTGHIIDMAKTLGLAVVAEGVETETQLAYLHAHGVEYGQGWLFSKALRRDDYIAFHRRRRQHYGNAR